MTVQVNLIHSKLVFFIKKNCSLKKINSASEFIIHYANFFLKKTIQMNSAGEFIIKFTRTVHCIVFKKKQYSEL